MIRLARTVGRLADGSSTLARHLAARTAAWVARGRRHDLTGWRAALGCWARLSLLAFGLYLLWRLVRAVPQLMWLLTGAWTALAYRAGKPRPAPAEEPAPAPREDVREATLTWIRQQIGDRQGVHLRTLLQHAQAHGMFEGLDVATFRGHLQRWGIPVHRGVKVAGVPTWGVRLRDLDDAPSPVAAEEASTEASTAA